MSLSLVSSEPILIPDSLVAQPQKVSGDITTLRIGMEDFEFAQSHIDAYPMLLDPRARFRLSFAPCYRLILGYPASSLPSEMLDSPSEKETFLANCAFFDLKLSPEVIIHLCSDKKKELEKVGKYVQKKSGKKNVSFWLKKSVQAFCEKELSAFKDLYDESLKPLDIVRHLDLGLIDKLLLHDWEVGKGSVSAFLDRFTKQFFQ